MCAHHAFPRAFQSCATQIPAMANTHKTIFAKIVLCVFAIAGICVAQDWNARGKAWWAHIQYLADDKWEGRGIGSEGFKQTAAYVTEQFKRAGLQPAGERGYAQ